jgi:hypothetical protein
MQSWTWVMQILSKIFPPLANPQSQNPSLASFQWGDIDEGKFRTGVQVGVEPRELESTVHLAVALLKFIFLKFPDSKGSWAPVPKTVFARV